MPYRPFKVAVKINKLSTGLGLFQILPPSYLDPPMLVAYYDGVDGVQYTQIDLASATEEKRTIPSNWWLCIDIWYSRQVPVDAWFKQGIWARASLPYEILLEPVLWGFYTDVAQDNSGYPKVIIDYFVFNCPSHNSRIENVKYSYVGVTKPVQYQGLFECVQT